MSKVKSFILELFFPKFCLGCQREGVYLCQDCQSTIEILEYQYCLCRRPFKTLIGGKCQRCYSKSLDGLYFAAPYHNYLIKKLIQYFKYPPYLVRDLAFPLANLIITHLQLLDIELKFSDFVLIPLPLSKKKLKERGFNQTEELAKEIAKPLNNLAVVSDVLIKTKETLAQVELSDKERKKNVKGVFLCKNREKISKRKILLVDDVYTTGSTLEEAAKVLKMAGAKEVWGLTIARANPGEDKL